MSYCRLLITGGAGFIGSNFIRYVLERNPQIHIINLDLLTYSGSLENLKNLPKNSHYKFFKADICDKKIIEELMNTFEIDCIVHFAAESHVDRSIESPPMFMNTNILGTFTLLEAARNTWMNVKRSSKKNVRFHHISTDEVFGSLKPGELAFSESTPYFPSSPYAASKASSDHLVRAYYHTYGLPFTLTNCSNNYGPRQYPEKLIPLVILNALEGKPIPIYGDGMQIRDWLFVDDHCRAIWEVLQDGINGESYNVGGNNQVTNNEIVESICCLLDELHPDSPVYPHRKLIEYVTDRPGHDRRYAMDISKISKELGWKPDHAIKTGLRKTVEWYLSNKEWIEKIIAQQQYNNWVDQNYSRRGKA